MDKKYPDAAVDAARRVITGEGWNVKERAELDLLECVEEIAKEADAADWPRRTVEDYLTHVVPITPEAWAVTGYDWSVFVEESRFLVPEGTTIYMDTGDPAPIGLKHPIIEGSEDVLMWTSINDHHSAHKCHVYRDADDQLWITYTETVLRLC